MGFFGPSTAAPIPCHLSFRLPPPARRPARARPALTPPRCALPLELVVSIIEHAAFADDTLLRHCALVCRAWSLSAQKLLFTTVSLRSRPACDAFLAATDPASPRGRILAASVVRLRAVIDHNQPDALTQHSLALAVSRCPHLYDLALSLYGRAEPDTRMRRPAPSFDDTTLALLRAGPRISSLTFTNWSSNSHALAQLLAVWPSLHSLDIAGSTPPEPPEPFLQPFPAAIAQLRINFQSPPSLHFLHWLTHPATVPPSLRVLEFVREPPAQLLQALVDAHAHSILALALPGCTLPEHVRAVHACTRLCELRIENPCVLPKLWRALPPTLRHVAIGVDMNTPLQPLVDLVRARGGEDALRAVTVHTTNGGERHALFPVLKMVCAFNGVLLTVVRDVVTFREQLRGDPIPPMYLDFPRQKSLANIYVMRS